MVKRDKYRYQKPQTTFKNKNFLRSFFFLLFIYFSEFLLITFLSLCMLWFKFIFGLKFSDWFEFYFSLSHIRYHNLKHSEIKIKLV